MSEQFVRIDIENPREKAGCGGRIRNFAGHGEKRIYRDRHGQFLAVPVVDHATTRRKLNGSLLLVGSAGDEITVVDDLQLNQAEADQAEPEDENGAEEVQPLCCAVGWDAHRFTLEG